METGVILKVPGVMQLSMATGSIFPIVYPELSITLIEFLASVSSSFVFSCALSISVLNPKSSPLVFFPDISKSVFIAVALSICSLFILSCFIDVFGTSA